MAPRRAWAYRGASIEPRYCHNPDRPAWGKCAEPMDFGDGLGARTRWWCVTLPNGNWIHCGTKASAREIINDWHDSDEGHAHAGKQRSKVTR